MPTGKPGGWLDLPPYMIPGPYSGPPVNWLQNAPAPNGTFPPGAWNDPTGYTGEIVWQRSWPNLAAAVTFDVPPQGFPNVAPFPAFNWSNRPVRGTNLGNPWGSGNADTLPIYWAEHTINFANNVPFGVKQKGTPPFGTPYTMLRWPRAVLIASAQGNDDPMVEATIEALDNLDLTSVICSGVQPNGQSVAQGVPWQAAKFSWLSKPSDAQNNAINVNDGTPLLFNKVFYGTYANTVYADPSQFVGGDLLMFVPLGAPPMTSPIGGNVCHPYFIIEDFFGGDVNNAHGYQGTFPPNNSILGYNQAALDIDRATVQACAGNFRKLQVVFMYYGYAAEIAAGCRSFGLSVSAMQQCYGGLEQYGYSLVDMGGSTTSPTAEQLTPYIQNFFTP